VHPYTQSLIAAVPQIHTKWKTSGAGPPTNGFGHTAGSLVEVEPGHFAARAAGE
jgi:hypothetical protein